MLVKSFGRLHLRVLLGFVVKWLTRLPVTQEIAGSIPAGTVEHTLTITLSNVRQRNITDQGALVQ